MALLESKQLPLSSPLIDFSLPDPDGKLHCPSDFAGRKVLVIIFMCNHCPYIHAVIDRLVELQNSYEPQDVQLIGINANDWSHYPDDSPEKMKEFITERKISFPYLYDEKQEIAKAYQAVCTPDIFVFGSYSEAGGASPLVRGRGLEGGEEKRLAYHGRIDDNWKEPEKVTKKDLKVAIDSLLKGEKPAQEQYSSMGCSIKWKA
ncbi:MAG: thioredoxin family protein [bacterium]|nr:thioredoxin family protein [bacterium]